MELIWRTTTVEVIEGSIVELDVDAIVNEANAPLAGGGGVDGAIHRAAGPELYAACQQFPEVEPGIRCPPGEVRVTPGFLLKQPLVLHTVGPIWFGGAQGEPETLASCYRVCLAEAERRGLSSLAFPAISTGVYGYPIDRAAQVAAHETRVFAERRATPFRVVMSVLGAEFVEAQERALMIESRRA